MNRCIASESARYESMVRGGESATVNELKTTFRQGAPLSASKVDAINQLNN